MTEILTPRGFARVVERKQLWAVGGSAAHAVGSPTAHNCLQHEGAEDAKQVQRTVVAAMENTLSQSRWRKGHDA